MWNPYGRPAATACVRGADGLCGMVRLYQWREGVVLTADFCGLPASKTGFFALHIHEGTDCGGADFSNTGAHFDMDKQMHPLHDGDLPPLLSCDGRAYLAVLTNRFRVQDVLGRSVVLHAQPDDFRSQPAGNAGPKIACGVICGC